SGIDAVARALAGRGVLPATVLGAGGRGERDRPRAERHEQGAADDLRVTPAGGAAQLAEHEDSPEQSPELVRVRKGDPAADADVFRRVLLEQVSHDPEEPADQEPEEHGARAQELGCEGRYAPAGP